MFKFINFAFCMVVICFLCSIYFPHIWIFLVHNETIRIMVYITTFLILMMFMYSNQISHSNDYLDEFNKTYDIGNGMKVIVKIIDEHGSYKLTYKEGNKEETKNFKTTTDISTFLHEKYGIEE